ncbi:Taurine catabolism dioxygenase TauD/TfdA [Metarhizium album ARSEF 1941]|uniref:Taurine catabolism dioxygenase TauD/TfdA n=1 Tax=Metarhizium album (strain ARSEF 1941) TaxID=1081103 RepID=A0A0B2WUK3_METAS|nr:Taurine catabolism dioxygenase TauD/TfdA [Metarhizium album ARSEF 1941]KHN97279.1 Taurine catabolism dioxygenase TauD/TfdA [Metarhizium album ARSEF 1941]
MYALHLTSEDITELDHALEAFKALCLDGDEVSKENFPLPRLGERLEKCSEVLHKGTGFFVMKGIDMSRYTVEDSVVIYLGMASYIADQRGIQDREGNVLRHVTSSKTWDVPPEKRHGIHSNAALPFHNDMGCDILGLQVRHCAHRGGSTFVSSAASIFNELLSKEPQVVRTLFEPNWPVQCSGRNAQHHYLAPVMAWHDGRLMTCMDPNRFGPHPASGGSSIPVLTQDQKYALEKLEEAAWATELELDLARGDVLFLNNWALLHRREAYEDNELTCRHLIRLWLRSTQHGWHVPPEMRLPWQTAYNDKIQPRIYALHPSPTYSTPKYSVGSAAFLLYDD